MVLIKTSDLFKKSFAFYKSKLYLIMTLALIPFANFVIISLFIGIIGSQVNKTIFFVGLGLVTFLFSLLSLMVNLWVQIAFFYAVREKEAKTNAKNLLALSWSKIFSYSWVLFLMGVISIAGFMLFIVPGIIFSIWFSLSLYVFVFENLKGMQALYRSKELVKGHWWAVFGRLFIFGLVAGLFGAIPVVGPLANIFFTMPFGVIYGYFIYDNLKTLKV